MIRSKKVLPPVYFLVTVAMMAALNYFAPIRNILHPPFTYSGAVFVIIGFFIMIWSAVLFNKAGTAIKPFDESTHMVTEGMYQLTRNPMYLGMVFILFGIALLFGTLTPFIPIPIFIWIIQTTFISHEENALERTFGDNYREYKERVRRWL